MFEGAITKASKTSVDGGLYHAGHAVKPMVAAAVSDDGRTAVLQRAISDPAVDLVKQMLRADPSVSCATGSERDGLVVASVVVLLLFWPGFVAFCVRIVRRARENGGALFTDERFLVQFGALFSSYYQSSDDVPLWRANSRKSSL